MDNICRGSRQAGAKNGGPGVRVLNCTRHGTHSHTDSVVNYNDAISLHMRHYNPCYLVQFRVFNVIYHNSNPPGALL